MIIILCGAWGNINKPGGDGYRSFGSRPKGVKLYKTLLAWEPKLWGQKVVLAVILILKCPRFGADRSCLWPVI